MQLGKDPGKGPFPCLVGKGIQAFPSHLKGRHDLMLKLERNSRDHGTIQKDPDSQSTPFTPDSNALTGLSPGGSTQNTMACVTALWHLKRKPQIPMTNRQHSLCCLFWDPTPTSNRKLKGRLEGHLLLFKRGHNFLVLFFHLRFWFKCPISAFLGGFAYNGSLHSSPLLSQAWVIFPLLQWMGTVIAFNFQIDL